MSRVTASARQRKCRNDFKEAVDFARQVIADPVLKATWQKRLRRRNGVYNEAIKVHMLKDQREKERSEILTDRMIRLAFKNEAAIENAEIICPTKISQNIRIPEVNYFMDTG